MENGQTDAGRAAGPVSRGATDAYLTWTTILYFCTEYKVVCLDVDEIRTPDEVVVFGNLIVSHVRYQQRTKNGETKKAKRIVS